MGHERCPRCADSLRIVRVTFKWSGTRLFYACPNCAQDQDSVLKADAPPDGQIDDGSTGAGREARAVRSIIGV
jgi:hypothetical protein